MAEVSEEYQVAAVRFTDEGAVVDFIVLPTDVRMDGQLVMQRQLAIEATRHPDYREDVLKLHDRVVRMLKNALEDFEESGPYVPEPPTSEDDEMGSATR